MKDGDGFQLKMHNNDCFFLHIVNGVNHAVPHRAGGVALFFFEKRRREATSCKRVGKRQGICNLWEETKRGETAPQHP